MKFYLLNIGDLVHWKSAGAARAEPLPYGCCI